MNGAGTRGASGGMQSSPGRLICAQMWRDVLSEYKQTQMNYKFSSAARLHIVLQYCIQTSLLPMCCFSLYCKALLQFINRLSRPEQASQICCFETPTALPNNKKRKISMHMTAYASHQHQSNVTQLVRASLLKLLHASRMSQTLKETVDNNMRMIPA